LSASIAASSAPPRVAPRSESHRRRRPAPATKSVSGSRTQAERIRWRQPYPVATSAMPKNQQDEPRCQRLCEWQQGRENRSRAPQEDMLLQHGCGCRAAWLR
jgi:predicted alpha/beta hydrolase family esterase